MKIGFVGNTNNYPFTLAAALIRKGVDVRFLIDSPYLLHRPESRMPSENIGYGEWIFDLAPMRTWDVVLPTARHHRARRLLADRDVIVANSWGIAFSALLQKPSFVISTGSDLDALANDAHLADVADESTGGVRKYLRSQMKLWLYRRLIPLQRAGFRNAAGVEYAFPGVLPHGDDILTEIGIPLDQRYCFMLTDLERLRQEPLPENPVLRILGIARINWKEPLWPGSSVLDNKRTDRLIEGVMRYRERTGRQVELRLFRKGKDVAETEKLASQRGVSDSLIWLDEMPLAQFTRQIIEADIVADHFGEGSIGVGARDALALGRPVIAAGMPDVFDATTGEQLPIVPARSPDEIATAIEQLEQRSARESYAARGRRFAERHFSAEKAADTILCLFKKP